MSYDPRFQTGHQPRREPLKEQLYADEQVSTDNSLMFGQCLVGGDARQCKVIAYRYFPQNDVDAPMWPSPVGDRAAL